MAFRDFYPLSETAAQPATEPLAPAYDTLETMVPATEELLSNSDTSYLQAEAEPILPAINVLAVNMEHSRQKLLELLIEHPLARNLLSKQLADNAGEGVDFSVSDNHETIYPHIVQDNIFVQPDLRQINGAGAWQATESINTADSYRRAELNRIHYFPALLIRIADRILQTECEPPPAYAGYNIKLLEYRRRLQEQRQQMIVGNTGLVAFVAYKHKATSLSFDDLMQEGIVGLIRAIDRFDPNRGIRFSTYAVFWIKQAIARLIIKQEKVVRLPVALAEKASVVFDAMRNCYLETNRWPSQTELGERCGLSPEEIKTVSSYYQATHSLDASLSEENEEQTLMHTLHQRQFALPLNELIDNNLSLYICNVVASLPEKEAAILNMRFGLKNHTEMTLQAIADQLHVTRERVRQIQNRALKKLKQQFGYDLLPFLEPNDS